MTYEQVQRASFRDELEKIAILGIGGAANPFKGGPGMFQQFGKDLMAGGKMLGSQKLVAPGQFAPAGLAQRTVGEMANSAGHHYAHKSTFSNVLNPLGGAVGGMAEGLTRQAGKEVSGLGQRMGGRAGGALQQGGSGLQRAAKHVGMAGEVAGLAGLGTGLGAPLSAAGLIGGKALAAAPVVEHALHGMGHAVHHAASDLTGIAGGTIGNKARTALGMVPKAVPAPRTGYSMMPPPMAAAHA